MSETYHFRRPIFRAVLSSEAERARRTYSLPLRQLPHVPREVSPEQPQTTITNREHYLGRLVMNGEMTAQGMYDALGKVAMPGEIGACPTNPTSEV